MEQEFTNEDCNFICSLKYIQNKNASTQINLLDQTFFVKYNNLNIINRIKSNNENLNKVLNYIPKLLENNFINEHAICLDFIPAGSLADIIFFNEKKIESPFINEIINIKMAIIDFIVNISEIFIKNELIHTSFTPEHILFTNNKKVIIGGIEYIQPLANHSDFFTDKDTPFSIYIPPEVKEGRPVVESFSYSLSLLIYSILTFSFVSEIPQKCPKNMERSFFLFLISCCSQQPSKRPKITDIKNEIAKFYKNSTDLKFDELYSNSQIYGTKDNFVNLIEMKYPIGFYIVGSTFLNGNIYDMTPKEAISFLNASSKLISENEKEYDSILNNYQKKAQIYLADIDEQLEKIRKIPNPVSNISFYNDDPSLVDDQMNISIFDACSDANEFDGFQKYGFFGFQAINDIVEASKQTSYPIDDLFTNQPSPLLVDNQNLNNYQSIANAKLACREKCDTVVAHSQKRNVNFHSFTQIGALQVASRMFSELSSNINYDIILNTGRGLHSTKPESSNMNSSKMSVQKNPNLEGNESILCSTLSKAVEKFTGERPSIGENPGTLTSKIINIEKEENEDDFYF